MNWRHLAEAETNGIAWNLILVADPVHGAGEDLQRVVVAEYAHVNSLVNIKEFMEDIIC